MIHRLLRRALIAFTGLASALAAPAAAIPWTDNQAAEYTIGTRGAAASAQSVGVADAVAIDAAHGKFYVTDRQNHRVLRFAYPATTNEPAAEAVFGQPDFTSGAPNRGRSGPAADTLNVPYGLAVAANGDLWVTDSGNHRLLKFPAAYNATSGVAASRVLGQPSFTAGTGATAADRLQSPSSLALDAADNLWVADSGNSRVVRFASVSTAADGASAAQVLGQASFTIGANNRGAGATASSLNCPYAVCAVGTTLWVADSQNHRVLRFANAASRSNGPTADGVLGQGDFISTAANRGATPAAHSLHFPAGLTADDAGTLIVSDSFNQRILIFTTAAAKAPGAPADHFLGAGSFNGAGSIHSAWNTAYDNTRHRLLVAWATGGRVTQYFNAYDTATTLTSDANPAPLAAAIAFTATVRNSAAGGPAPTGTVRFSDGAAVLGTAPLDAAGNATCRTAALAEGDHTIVATYLEGSAHRSSASAPLTQTVGRFTPTITLATSADPACAGDALVLTATVTPPAGTTLVPTGAVAFSVDGITRATVALGAAGRASYTVSDLMAGSHALTATYNGDARLLSVATTRSQTVIPAGLRRLPAVANVERDDNGSETVVYSGVEWAGIIYAGLYEGSTCWAAYRFDLSTAKLPIQKAELKLHVCDNPTSPATVPVEIHGSLHDTWSDTVAPPTAPASLLSPAIATVDSDTFATGDWLTIDVTDFVASQLSGDKLATFVITAPLAPAEWIVGFHSREAGANAPVLEITEAMTYAKWATGNFTAAELADSTTSGANADPDGSGLANLLRYALGLPARGPVANPVVTTCTGTTATLTFPRRAATGDLRYSVQSSTDLVTWTAAATYTDSADTRTETCNVALPPGATRLFLRLKVEQLP